MDKFRLIAEIQKRPSLWQPQNSRCRQLTDDLWKEVAKLVGTDVRTCKSKWGQLRRAYHQQQMRSQELIQFDISKEKYNCNQNYDSKWAYFEHLKFLDRITKDKLPHVNNAEKVDDDFEIELVIEDSDNYSSDASERNFSLNKSNKSTTATTTSATTPTTTNVSTATTTSTSTSASISTTTSHEQNRKCEVVLIPRKAAKPQNIERAATKQESILQLSISRGTAQSKANNYVSNQNIKEVMPQPSTSKVQLPLEKPTTSPYNQINASKEKLNGGLIMTYLPVNKSMVENSNKACVDNKTRNMYVITDKNFVLNANAVSNHSSSIAANEKEHKSISYIKLPVTQISTLLNKNSSYVKTYVRPRKANATAVRRTTQEEIQKSYITPLTKENTTKASPSSTESVAKCPVQPPKIDVLPIKEEPLDSEQSHEKQNTSVPVAVANQHMTKLAQTMDVTSTPIQNIASPSNTTANLLKSTADGAIQSPSMTFSTNTSATVTSTKSVQVSNMNVGMPIKEEPLDSEDIYCVEENVNTSNLREVQNNNKHVQESTPEVPRPKRIRLADISPTLKQNPTSTSSASSKPSITVRNLQDQNMLETNLPPEKNTSIRKTVDIGDLDCNFLISFLTHMKSMSQFQNLKFRANMSNLMLNILSTKGTTERDTVNILEKKEQSYLLKDLLEIGDPDCNFLVSFLPHLKSMSQLQNLQFRAKMADLMLNIFSVSAFANTVSDSTT